MHISEGGGLTANNDTFIGNGAFLGGGIYAQPDTTATVSNCSFIDNTAAAQGTIGYFGNAIVISTDNIFVGNSPTDIGTA